MDKKDIVEIITEVLSRWQHKENKKSPAISETNTNTSATISALSLAMPEMSANHPKRDDGSSFKKGFFASGRFNQPFTTLKNKRPFISEYDLKQMLVNNPTLTVKIPRNAVISPLALEIIESRGIKVIYV